MGGGGEEEWEGNEDFRPSSFGARHAAGKPRCIQKQETAVTG